MTQKLMTNGMRKNYFKLKIQKIKLVQKVFFANLIIHSTITPTHMGTKHKTAAVNHTQNNLIFLYYLVFYDFLIRLTLTGAN